MKIKILNLSKDLVKINNNNNLLSNHNNNNKFQISQLNKLNKNKSQLKLSRIKLLFKKPRNHNKLLLDNKKLNRHLLDNQYNLNNNKPNNNNNNN